MNHGTPPRHRHADRSPAVRTGSTRGVGLFVAFLVAVVTIAGLWYISSSAPKAKPVTKPTDVNVGAAPKPDDDLSGDQISLQLVDRDNPGRLAAELKLPSVQPLAAKRYAVESPSGWVYPRDGRVVHIRADKGDLFLPNRQQLPERGEFKGNVIVRLFAGPAGRPIDPDKETPLLIARTDTIAFDGAIGELQVPGRITIDGSGVAYAGSSLRILFNDPEQRIELLTAEQSEYLRIDPKATRTPPSLFSSRDAAANPSAKAMPGANASLPPATATVPGGNGPSAPSPAIASTNPREQLYRIRVEEAVRVVQAARTIDAAAGEIYTRQSGSSSVASTTLTSRTTRITPPQNPQRTSHAGTTTAAITTVSFQAPSTTAPPPHSPTAPLSSSDSPVTITWLGRLELRPSAANATTPTPEVLVNNDLAAVFYGGTNAPARVVDSKAELSASGDTITYLDTRREARIWSDPTSKAGLGSVLTAKGRGRVLATAASMNLATGIATFTGAGQMENSDSESATPLPPLPARGSGVATTQASGSRSIAWKDSALLRFKPDNRPGSTPTGDPSVLEFASFKGSVIATGGGSSITADAVEASFVQAPGAEQPSLSVVTLTGRAKGSDSKGGTLGADRVEVRFSPPLSGSKSNEAVAQGLIARGNVVASSKGSTLHADALDAALSTDATPDANLGVTIAHAKGAVRFSRADGVGGVTRAESDELIADVPNQQAQLAGPVVVLAKGDSSVTGERMLLDGTTGRLEVVGPGVFQHEGRSKDGEPRLASARWTGVGAGMTFEDSTGVLEATSPNGRTVAEAMPDARTIDKLEAAFVRVLLTPSPADAPAKDREVLSVVATAAPPESEASASAATPSDKPSIVKVESRRYAAAITDLDEGDKKPALDRLLYLESTRVEADNAKGTVHVPAPGKMFVLAGKDALAEVGRGEQEGVSQDKTPTSSPSELTPQTSPLPAYRSADLSADSTRLGRSRTLFSWKNAMTMTRAAAATGDDHSLVMEGIVKLTSVRESDQSLTQLDCDKLSAWLTPSQAGRGEQEGVSKDNAAPSDSSPLTPQTSPLPASSTDLRGELSRALAEGTARLKSGTKTLLGDLIDYNPADGTALAGSRDNSNVTLFDDASASPVTARGILWDMKRGRIEVKNVSTVVAPR